MTCQQCRINMSRPRDVGDGLTEAAWEIFFMGATMNVCTAHKNAFQRRMLRAGRSDFKIFILPQSSQDAGHAEARQ